VKWKRDATESAILQALTRVGAQYVLLQPFDVLVWFRGGSAIPSAAVERPENTGRRDGGEPRQFSR
jgi:hypothetical protein